MSENSFHLLVVDDNRIDRLKLSRALEGLGYEVHAAEGGAPALEMLRAQQFDLVLLDLVMPGMDGQQVLQHIKADESLRDIPVLLVSGLDDKERIQACMDLGAEGHLKKPVSSDELERSVAACLGKS